MFKIAYQDGVSPLMEMMVRFHDWLIIFLIIVSALTLGGIKVINNRITNRRLIESNEIETAWTILPVYILIGIGVPSLQLLYIVEGENISAQTVKAIGHQWYWHYDYPDLPPFDSYLVRRSYRHLEVDNRLFVPVNSGVQMLITAADVLHSWTVPTMGVKADAVPGRINKLHLISKRPGIYYGQCSEICGRNHRFIPITVECYSFN